MFTTEEKPETAKLKKETAGRYLKKVRVYKKSGQLLDIGSAFGYLMEVAEGYGFEVFGVELSSFSSAIAKKKFGSKVFAGRLEEAKFTKANFDVITMFDLIEHIPQPLEFMKEVRRVLKTGGFIAITTPDTGSLSYWLLGLGGWFHWKFEHLGYFNHKSIEELARHTGFTVVEKKRAYKAMSFQYLFDQFKMFPHPIFSPLMNLFAKIIPESLKHKTFLISGGEMFVVLKAN
ncbi:MAG: class I SAM-dependent methyltransferase [bacterium]|nr:class I SAM-dependent methyltransferase [bacterium]